MEKGRGRGLGEKGRRGEGGSKERLFSPYNFELNVSRFFAALHPTPHTALHSALHSSGALLDYSLNFCLFSPRGSDIKILTKCLKTDVSCVFFIVMMKNFDSIT